MRRIIILAALGLWACGGGGGSGPVSHSPLAGTFDGRPWTAGTAIAEPGFSSGDMSVTIYEQGTDAGCENLGAPLGDRELLGDVPWTANSSYPLSLQHTFTFSFMQPDGGFGNLASTTGQVELDGAPTAPDGGTATTTLRVRSQFDDQNSVEGQVTVTVCPGL